MGIVNTTKWSKTVFTGNSQFVFSGSVLYVVSNTTDDGQFSILKSTDLGDTFSLLANQTGLSAGFDPAVYLDSQGMLWILGTVYADGGASLVLFKYNTLTEGSPISSSLYLTQNSQIGRDYDLAQLPTGNILVVSSVINASGLPNGLLPPNFNGEAVVSFEIDGTLGTVVNTHLLVSSPFRSGETYGSISTLTVVDGVELYVGSHSKSVSPKDFPAFINYYKYTTRWPSNATPQIYSFPTRHVDDRMTIVSDGNKRYLSQCFYTQTRYSMVANALLGYNDGASWKWNIIPGTSSRSITDPVINVTTEGTVSFSYLEKDFTLVGSDMIMQGTLHVKDLDVSQFPNWTLPQSDQADYLRLVTTSRLRGTKDRLPSEMGYALLAESRLGDGVFYTGHNVSPTASLEPSTIVLKRGQTPILDASGSDDPNGDNLVMTWSSSDPAVIVTPIVDANGVSSKATISTQPGLGPLSKNAIVSVVVIDVTSRGTPIHTYDPNSSAISNTRMIAQCAVHIPINSPPVIGTLPIQTVTRGKRVTLSPVITDPDGDTLTYSWKQTAGSPISLDVTNQASLTFTTRQASFDGETLSFQLTVTDGVNTPVVGVFQVIVNPFLFFEPSTFVTRGVWTSNIASRNSGGFGYTVPNFTSAIATSFNSVKRFSTLTGENRTLVISPNDAMVFNFTGAIGSTSTPSTPGVPLSLKQSVSFQTYGTGNNPPDSLTFSNPISDGSIVLALESEPGSACGASAPGNWMSISSDDGIEITALSPAPMGSLTISGFCPRQDSTSDLIAAEFNGVDSVNSTWFTSGFCTITGTLRSTIITSSPGPNLVVACVKTYSHIITGTPSAGWLPVCYTPDKYAAMFYQVFDGPGARTFVWTGPPNDSPDGSLIMTEFYKEMPGVNANGIAMKIWVPDRAATVTVTWNGNSGGPFSTIPARVSYPDGTIQVRFDGHGGAAAQQVGTAFGTFTIGSQSITSSVTTLTNLPAVGQELVITFAPTWDTNHQSFGDPVTTGKVNAMVNWDYLTVDVPPISFVQSTMNNTYNIDETMNDPSYRTLLFQSPVTEGNFLFSYDSEGVTGYGTTPTYGPNRINFIIDQSDNRWATGYLLNADGDNRDVAGYSIYPPTPDGPDIVVAEFSGVNSAQQSILGINSNDAPGFTTSNPPGTPVLLIATFKAYTNPFTIPAPAGWQTLMYTPGHYAAVFYKIFGAPGNYACDWSGCFGSDTNGQSTVAEYFFQNYSGTTTGSGGGTGTTTTDTRAVTLRRFFPPAGTKVLDAVQTEDDYTIVLADDQRLYKFTTAPAINSDNFVAYIDLSALTTMKFTGLYATPSYADVRVISLIGPGGCFLLQIEDTAFVTITSMEISPQSSLLYGGSNVQWVRTSNVENIQKGKLLLGTTQGGSTYETLVDLKNRRILGTWDVTNMKNVVVKVGEILFENQSTYMGFPTPPTIHLYSTGTPSQLFVPVWINWTIDRPDLVTSYEVQTTKDGSAWVSMAVPATNSLWKMSLQQGFTHQIRMRATNPDGISNWSNILSVPL